MATKAPAKIPAKKPAAEAEDKKPQVTELVNTKTGEVMTLEEAYAGYVEDEGGGFELQTSEDTGIPYLSLMQPLSPEVSAEGSEVKPGSWVNRGTSIVYPSGIDFVPAITRHVFREWSSKEPTSSAPIADHAIDSPMIIAVRRDQSFGDYTHPENPEHPLTETFDVFGIQLTADGFVPAVMSFSSTGIRPYKDWMLKARSVIMTLPGSGKKINPPLFAHVYHIASKRVEKKPHIWWVPEVRFADPAGAEKSRLLPTDEIYQAAKLLKETVLSGQVRVQQPSREAVGDEALKRASTDNEKAPY